MDPTNHERTLNIIKPILKYVQQGQRVEDLDTV